MIPTRAKARPRIRAAVTAVTLSMALALTGCSTGGSAPGETKAATVATQAQIDAAMKKKVTLSYWGWAPQTPGVLDAFKKAYPNITLKYTNTGSGSAEYLKLQNALKAKSGIPDVAQFDYSALPQFVLSKALVDLRQYDFAKRKADFATPAWSQVNVQGGLYGVPQDSGPLAFFYRDDLFKQYGLTVPTTWDQYVADARKLHEADSSKFMTADTGDPQQAQALMWQAGGKPYDFDGTTGKVSLTTDPGVQKWAKMYSPLLEEGLLDTGSAGYTPEWVAKLCGGTYSALIAGGWGAGTLQYFCPKTAGRWRVAPIPQYAEGEKFSGQQGGSAMSVLDASTNKLAALGFAQWFATSKEAQDAWGAAGGFPSSQAVISSSAWLDQKSDFFGGQQINRIFADSTEAVRPGWSYLPYDTYAGSVFSDTAGRAWVKKTSLTDGLASWEQEIVRYGNAQGFSVNK